MWQCVRLVDQEQPLLGARTSQWRDSLLPWPSGRPSASAAPSLVTCAAHPAGRDHRSEARMIVWVSVLVLGLLLVVFATPLIFLIDND